MAMSTSTDPGFICATSSLETSRGARAPGTSTAPITRSAASTWSRIDMLFDAMPWMRLSNRQNVILSFSRSLSSMVTWAPMPRATLAAFWPAVPAPITTTCAFWTPPMPPSRTPGPPYGFMRA